jgi:hypothetical protein
MGTQPRTVWHQGAHSDRVGCRLRAEGSSQPSVLSSSGASAAYGSDILAILDLYYKQPLGMIPSLILLLTTQCIGFGLAGESETVRRAHTSRHAADTARQHTLNVLAGDSRHSAALYHTPSFILILNTITSSHDLKAEAFHHLDNHSIHLPIPTCAPVPDFDVGGGALPCKRI